MIPLFKPFICQEAKDNVKRVLDSSWIGMGPEVAAFEKEFAEYIGCKYAIATNSGTEALRIAVLCSGFMLPNAYVVTTPNTFVSTNHMLLQNRIKPIFADIDVNTGNISVESIARLLKKFTFSSVLGLMVVHYGGLPVDLDEVSGLVHSIPVIEDCAHACGSVYRGRKIGENSRAAAFSFHAVKNLSTGDGGMFVTNDESMMRWARKLIWLGIDSSTAERTKEGSYKWEYDVPIVGYKSHMNDITAAIGRGQLKFLDTHNARRSELVSIYRDELSSIRDNIWLLDEFSDRRSSYHLIVVRCKDADLKKKIIEKLNQNDIQSGYHYKPNYLYPPYSRFPRDGAMPGMEVFYKTALTLPLYYELKEDEVKQICDLIEACI